MIRWLTSTPEEHILRDILYKREIAKMTYNSIGKHYNISLQQARNWYSIARILLPESPS